jgi:FkbM family methyltransferase
MILERILRKCCRLAGIYVFPTETMGRGIVLDVDLTRLLGEDGARVIFDVGANIGQMSESFSACFPRAEIHAFEPIRATCERLTSNTKANPRIHAHCLALGEEDGEATMQTGAQSERNRVVPSADAAAALGAERVEMRRLDSFCQARHIERIDLLKTDCEGHDPQVLRGSEAMLSAGRVRLVLCEVNFRRDGANGDFFQIESYLGKFGYAFYALYNYSSWRRDVSTSGFANALFASKEVCVAQRKKV